MVNDLQYRAGCGLVALSGVIGSLRLRLPLPASALLLVALAQRTSRVG